MNANDHIQLILSECDRQRLIDPSQQAYVLATTQHETAGTYAPIEEIGGPQYCSRYDGREDLGNCHPGDGYKFRGRGYVQITGRRNYQHYSGLTSKNLIDFPDLAKEPHTAAFILVHGFKNGVFTGARIDSYIKPGHCDFYNARRCINGLDRAALIAGYARTWLLRLPSAYPRILRLTEPPMTGKDVGALQLALRSHGVKVDKADMVFGPSTMMAVEEFQRRNGLTVDGVVGPATRLSLGLK